MNSVSSVSKLFGSWGIRIANSISIVLVQVGDITVKRGKICEKKQAQRSTAH